MGRKSGRKRALKRGLLWAVALGMAVLGIASAWTLYRGHETLERLIHPIGTRPPTPVFGRWLELTPETILTPDTVTAWLTRLGYKTVEHSPQNPEEYRRRDDTVEVYLRGFQYPDRDFPAKNIVLHMKNGRLKSTEEASGGNLPAWRLEPIVMARWGSEDEERRPRIRLVDLPPYVPGAVLAVEDKRFYNHWGIDGIGLARALWQDVRHRAFRQGGSTLTQQLARSVFLDTKRTLRRKILEAAMTVYLEWRFTKPQLLEMYLNQVYWGQDGVESVFGIAAASQRYFGKGARDLSIAEAATLAGMLQSPNRYSPRTAPKMARERRDRVLRLMREQNRISKRDEQLAKSVPVKAAPSTTPGRENAYFLSWIRAQLEDRYTAEALSSQGWRIFTTLDPLWQVFAQKSLTPRVGQAALVAIEPGTGAIRAWLGGTNFAQAPFDRVVYALRQPGSAFKPLVALTALTQPQYTLATLLNDAPLTLTGEGGSWSPKNYDHKYRGNVSIRQALVQSLNVPIVRLAKSVGIAPILAMAQRAGIESPLRPDLATALGASETNLLELTNAYATLAASGLRAKPYGIQTIQTLEGEILEEQNAAPEPAIDPGATFLVTQALTDVFDVGTAASARKNGFVWPAAGKTGTSENFQDAWFVGYSPDIAIGVWVGEDQPKSLGSSAAALALPIWTRFADQIWKGRAAWTWEKPSIIETATIDPESGLLARSGCPTRRDEFFIRGTEPTTDCPRHSGGVGGWFKRMWQPKKEPVKKVTGLEGLQNLAGVCGSVSKAA